MISDYLSIVVDLWLPFAFRKAKTCQCHGTVCIYVFLSVVYFCIFIVFSPCNLGELYKLVTTVTMAIRLSYCRHDTFKSPNVSLGIILGLFVVWCLANVCNDVFVGCLLRVGSCDCFGSFYLLYFVLYVVHLSTRYVAWNIPSMAAFCFSRCGHCMYVFI